MTTNSWTPACVARVAPGRRPARSEIAIGFSVMTCFPARAATDALCRVQPRRCADRHDVAIGALRSISSIRHERTARRVPRPRRRARSASMSHTADSESPSTRPMASKWFLLMRPQPTSAMRNESMRSWTCSRITARRRGRSRHRAARTSYRTPCIRPTPASGRRSPHRHIQPMRRAGTPTISAYGGTSFVTTAPAPTNAYSPSVDAADDRRVGADRRAAPHQRATILVLARHVAARIHHVGEHHRRSAEHIVLELHALVDRHVVLDLAHCCRCACRSSRRRSGRGCSARRSRHRA